MAINVGDDGDGRMERRSADAVRGAGVFRADDTLDRLRHAAERRGRLPAIRCAATVVAVAIVGWVWIDSDASGCVGGGRWEERRGLLGQEGAPCSAKILK